MLTLYTAIGTLKFVKNPNGKSTPMVLNNHQEFGLCDHELILSSDPCLPDSADTRTGICLQCAA